MTEALVVVMTWDQPPQCTGDGLGKTKRTKPVTQNVVLIVIPIDKNRAAATQQADLVDYCDQSGFPALIEPKPESGASSDCERVSEVITEQGRSEVIPEQSSAPTIPLPEPDDEGHLLVHTVQRGLEVHDPVLTKDGSGGTYFMMSPASSHTKIAVFKPRDEEPGCSGNPRQAPESVDTEDYPDGSAAKLPRPGFTPGEGAMKEVLAYRLDHDHFAGVPLTLWCGLKLPHSDTTPFKYGSLQQFVSHKLCAWDIGPRSFDTERVHAIALLDLRLFNTDRHGGNILLAKEGCDEATGTSSTEKDAVGTTLVPIDHGYVLPAYPHVGDAWFEWLTWPQCKQPLSQRTLDYIEAIPLERDIEEARSLGLRSECVKTLKIGTMLVKKGAKAGLTVYEMGRIATKGVMDGLESSLLEYLCLSAEKGGGTEEDFFNSLSELMEREFKRIIEERVGKENVKCL
ncbi:phosphatidylinositol 4-kinase gamma 4 [Pelomyxa schiedti]|nr:phosphatidylinositol 4-kinase gamma 4 [Pelomyxa schiedti]